MHMQTKQSEGPSNCWHIVGDNSKRGIKWGWGGGVKSEGEGCKWQWHCDTINLLANVILTLNRGCWLERHLKANSEWERENKTRQQLVGKLYTSLLIDDCVSCIVFLWVCHTLQHPYVLSDTLLLQEPLHIILCWRVVLSLEILFNQNPLMMNESNPCSIKVEMFK